MTNTISSEMKTTEVLTSDTMTTKESAASVSSPSLLNSFRSEWYKISSLRSPWLVFGVVATLVALASGLLARFTANAISAAGDSTDAVGSLGSVQLANYLGVIAVVTVGALIGSGDFQHKTSVATLTQQPKRWQFLTAKVGFGIAASVAMAAGLFAASMAASAIYFPRIGQAPQIGIGDESEPELLGFLEVMPIATGHIVLAGLFGLGLGIATRSTTFAVSGFFVMRFVEVAIAGSSTHWATNLLPFKAGDRLLPYFEAASDPSRFGSQSASAIIYCSAIALLLAVGIFRTYKQDIA